MERELEELRLENARLKKYIAGLEKAISDMNMLKKEFGDVSDAAEKMTVEDRAAVKDLLKKYSQL